MAQKVGAEVPYLVIGANIPRPYAVGGTVEQSCAVGGEVTRPRAGGTEVLPLAVGRALCYRDLAWLAMMYRLARFVWFAPRY